MRVLILLEVFEEDLGVTMFLISVERLRVSSPGSSWLLPEFIKSAIVYDVIC